MFTNFLRAYLAEWFSNSQALKTVFTEKIFNTRKNYIPRYYFTPLDTKPPAIFLLSMTFTFLLSATSIPFTSKTFFATFGIPLGCLCPFRWRPCDLFRDQLRFRRWQFEYISPLPTSSVGHVSICLVQKVVKSVTTIVGKLTVLKDQPWSEGCSCREWLGCAKNKKIRQVATPHLSKFPEKKISKNIFYN